MIKLNDRLEEAFSRLFKEAMKARENAYAPYSSFKVGASVLSDSKKIYVGSNVEIKSFSLTICAERNAIFSALAKGEKRFLALAIVADTLPLPCGSCLEVMSEFFERKTLIGVYALSTKEKAYYRLEDLLPHPFVF